MTAEPSAVAGDAAYVDSLIAKAHAEHLATDPAWVRLGHWKKTLFGGYKSQADGPYFFLSDTGVSSPEAELDATLRGLFGVRPERADERASKIDVAFCRFPARMAWLASKLNFDPSKLDIHSCPKFEEYWSRMAPESATIVFSSYYMNNPASAFGHTFLRMHKHEPAVSREKRELLDYGIDFSAEANVKNPLLYAFMGLTGLFRGTFKLYPYYYKVREYNDYESRDLWEYDLGLTETETIMLAAHIWELGATYFDYFYLDENCSYHILGAIEAAAPRLRLLDHLKIPVIPADTVKALYANPGFVRGVHYRPSSMTQFHERTLHLSSRELDVVQVLSTDPDAPLPNDFTKEQQVNVFDAAADLVDIRFAKSIPVEPGGEGAKKKQRILERRALILVPSKELEIATPWEKLPHIGHGSSRIWGGTGYSSEDGPVYSLSYRLALHDLADPTDSYPEFAQMVFLPAEVRFYPKTHSFQLEGFDFARVVSLHEMDRFDHRLSWEMRAGADRIRDHGCNGCIVGNGMIGSGVTVPFLNHKVALFAMADFSFEGSTALHGIKGAPGIRAGVGPSGGMRVKFDHRLLWVTTAHFYWLPLAYSQTTYSAETALRWEYSKNFALGIEGKKYVIGEEGSLQTFFYF